MTDPQLKTLDVKASGSFPSWQYFICVATHCCWENQALYVQLHWKKTTRSLYLISSGLCPVCLFSLLTLNYPFTVINHNCEQNSFPEFCEFFSKSLNLRIVSGVPNIFTNNLQLLNRMHSSLPSLWYLSSLLNHFPLELGHKLLVFYHSGSPFSVPFTASSFST